MSSFERICWFDQRLKQNIRTTRRHYMDQFEISVSTFKRDLAFMRDRLGAPVDFAAGTDVISMRTVEPYRLHNYMGSWYLIAYCRHRKRPRMFQLARLIRLTLSHQAFQKPQFDVTAFMTNFFGLFKGTEQVEVVLHFVPFIARFIRNEVWFDGQQVEECADGSLIMTLPVVDLTEIKMKVLKYGRYVQVIKPAELRRLVAKEAAMIVKNYQDG
ncbi:MAG: WYL domain-containing protein [Desulfobacterales bacterium]|jgi:predicted DNA-binding transcriptional regulator YafY|nr:WYL domain-containing protein [Desulfobacterales bacterium]